MTQYSTSPEWTQSNLNSHRRRFVKIQHSFMIKVMNKLGSERSYINITKALHNKFTVKTVLGVYVREN